MMFLVLILTAVLLAAGVGLTGIIVAELPPEMCLTV